MKIVTMLFLLFGFFQTAAQSFYVKFGGGCAFPLASYPLGKNDSDVVLRETNPETGYYDFSIQRTENEVTGSFNSGIVSSATFGYIISSNMGVELSAGYVFGRAYKTTSKSKELLDSEVRFSGMTTESWQSANAFLAPSLVLTGTGDMVKPYLTAGPIFAMVRVDEEFRHHSEFDPNPVPTLRQEKYSGGLAIGARGTAGVDFRIGQGLLLFSEIAFTGMSYYPKEKELVKYEVDGEDILSTLSVRGKKVRFVKGTDYDSRSTQSSPDEPSNALRMNFGMNSLAAMAGLKILL